MKYLILIICVLVGCGADHSQDSIFFPDSPSTPGSSSSGSNSRGSVSAGPTRFLTSTGGYIQSAGGQTINVTSGETFQGFAVDANGQWLLTKKYTSGSMYHWILRNVNGSSANIVCSFLYATSLSGGLEVDGSSFYITISPSYGSFGVRRFSLSSCQDLGSVLSPLSISTSYNQYFSYDGGVFYMPRVGSYGSTGQTGLARLTPGSSSITIVSEQLVFGTENLDWTGYRTTSTVRNGVYWASTYSSSYSSYSAPHTLWKVSGSYVIGIVDYALSDSYSQIEKIAVSPSGRDLYAVTTSGSSISFQTFDVSGF